MNFRLGFAVSKNLMRSMRTTISAYVDGKQETMEVYITPVNESHSLQGFEKKSVIEVEKYSLTTPIPGTKNTYLIKNTVSKTIKIGNSKNPFKRLATLQTGNEAMLSLIACCIGGEEYERELHKRYTKNRGLGEWFILNDAEMEEIISEFKRRRDIPIPPSKTINDLETIASHIELKIPPFKAKNLFLIYNKIIDKNLLAGLINSFKEIDGITVGHHDNKTYVYVHFKDFLYAKGQNLLVFEITGPPAVHTIKDGYSTVKKWVERMNDAALTAHFSALSISNK
jgi:hypothetical protein